MKLTDSFTDERAVSPVVGVILMVAITVILAAVIGTFVLDLGSDQTAPPRAGITFDDDGSTLTATVSSAGNVESLALREAGTTSDIATLSDPSVGDTLQASGSDYSGGTEYIVVGTNNGQEGIVAETTTN